MYKEYFGLREAPFSIAPNPRYLYMSEGHREALAHLLYGLRSDGGLVLLTGEVGTGKTTLCRSLLEQVPADTDVAFLLNPKLTVKELLAAVCDELGIGYPESETSIKVFVDLLNNALLNAHARGRRTVLIIEEAQNLGADLLEQIRLLTNLETDEQKLLKIVLIGQPELRDMLARPDLRQISQRITARYHLAPLEKKEVGAYVTHRLTVAGGQRAFFAPSAVSTLARLSGGIPRLINLLSDRALLGAYAQGKDSVDRSIVKTAAAEVFGTTGNPLLLNKRLLWFTVPSLILSAAVVLGIAYHKRMASTLETENKNPALGELSKEPLPGIDILWWFGGRPVRSRPPGAAREEIAPGGFPPAHFRAEEDRPFPSESVAQTEPAKTEGRGIFGTEPPAEKKEDN